MKFILVDDEQRCNFCIYWTGMRKKDEDFICVDFDSAEWGICLCKKSVLYGKPMAACEGCSDCNNIKYLSQKADRIK